MTEEKHFHTFFCGAFQSVTQNMYTKDYILIYQLSENDKNGIVVAFLHQMLLIFFLPLLSNE